MLEKTGMLELTKSELDNIAKNGDVAQRLKDGWGSADVISEMVKSGEYRVVDSGDSHTKRNNNDNSQRDVS